MKKVITYGTFDLFHTGHENLLKRAKNLGDYLIVGVTTANYDKERGKLNVQKSLVERIEDVKRSGYADEIIVEEYEGQKIDDIQKYGVDIFAIGSDWVGKFDYLKDYCEVVYLDRTKGISSTQLRNESQRIVELGIIGSGRIANRFVVESKYVSGVDVKGIYNPRETSAKLFQEKHELAFYSSDLDSFLSKVNAVYIASPHLTHEDYIRACLERGVHVLCEKPMVLSGGAAKELYSIAAAKNLVLKEALKTAYAPAFTHLVSLLKSGAIGTIKDIDASFTKLITDYTMREVDPKQGGGSVVELASYVLLPIVKLLGTDYIDVIFYSYFKDNTVDLFTRGLVVYDNATASFKVGLGVKTEGELIVSGTKGYIYVPAPWWRASYFEIRYENTNEVKKYFFRYDGDGLRYELHDFITEINNEKNRNRFMLTDQESVCILSIIERFLNRDNVQEIK